MDNTKKRDCGNEDCSMGISREQTERANKLKNAGLPIIEDFITCYSCGHEYSTESDHGQLIMNRRPDNRRCIDCEPVSRDELDKAVEGSTRLLVEENKSLKASLSAQAEKLGEEVSYDDYDLTNPLLPVLIMGAITKSQVEYSVTEIPNAFYADVLVDILEGLKLLKKAV